MLQRLINELDFDWSILIEDTVLYSGYPLLRTLIQSSCHHNLRTICLDVDGTAADFISIPVDGIVIPLENADPLSLYDVITEHLTVDSVFVIPSLSVFLLKFGANKLASLLRLIKSYSSVKYMVGVLHTDVLLDTEHLMTIKYLFSALITLQKTPEDIRVHYNGCVKCMRHKSNGKLETSEEYYAMTNDFTLVQVHASTSSVIQNLVDASTGNDPMSNLTFNLSLSEQERRAKNKLQLPYLKKHEEKAALLTNR